MNKTRVTALRIMAPIAIAMVVPILFDNNSPNPESAWFFKLILAGIPIAAVIILWIIGEERYAENKKLEEREMRKEQKVEKTVYHTIYKEDKGNKGFNIILIIAAIATIIATIKNFL